MKSLHTALFSSIALTLFSFPAISLAADVNLDVKTTIPSYFKVEASEGSLTDVMNIGYEIEGNHYVAANKKIYFVTSNTGKGMNMTWVNGDVMQGPDANRPIKLSLQLKNPANETTNVEMNTVVPVDAAKMQWNAQTGESQVFTLVVNGVDEPDIRRPMGDYTGTMNLLFVQGA
jgi:hypothetical protein